MAGIQGLCEKPSVSALGSQRSQGGGPEGFTESWKSGVRLHFPPDASCIIPLVFQNRCTVPVDQASESLLKSKACFGAENLMRVLGNYCRLGEVRTHIRVGVVGKACGEAMGPRLLPWAELSLGKGFWELCVTLVGKRGL